MKTATAKTIHLVDALDPIESPFSPAQKAAILREARELASAPRPQPRVAPLPEPEDQVSKWRREVNAREAEMEREREHDRARQRVHERRLQRQSTQSWADYIAGQISAAVETERERNEEILIELLADVLRRYDDLVKRVAALEAGLKR
jgi:hypothetical protein